MSPQKIVVVGGGPVGALSALYAARRGYEVELYDLRDGELFLSIGTRFKQRSLSELTYNQLTRSELRRSECTPRHRSHTLGSFGKRHTGHRRRRCAWSHRRDLGQLETHLHPNDPYAEQQRKLEEYPNGVWPSRTGKLGTSCSWILTVVLTETVYAHST